MVLVPLLILMLDQVSPPRLPIFKCHPSKFSIVFNTVSISSVSCLYLNTPVISSKGTLKINRPVINKHLYDIHVVLPHLL